MVWVRPSPRDKKLATWRRDAIVAGIKVSLDTLKAEPKNSGIRDDVAGISYILYNPAPDKLDTLNWAVVKAEGWLNEGLPEGWSWHGQELASRAVAITELIALSPITILGLERTPYSSRVIWQENGADFDALTLKAFLERVQQSE